MKHSFGSWTKHLGAMGAIGSETAGAAVYPKRHGGKGFPAPPKCQSFVKQRAGVDWLGNGTLRLEFTEMSASFAKQAADRHPNGPNTGTINGPTHSLSQSPSKVWKKLQARRPTT